MDSFLNVILASMTFFPFRTDPDLIRNSGSLMACVVFIFSYHFSRSSSICNAFNSKFEAALWYISLLENCICSDSSRSPGILNKISRS